MIDLVDANKKYYFHKANAKRRNIDFLLSFEEWIDIWEKSGKWHLRGRDKNSYVMSRHNDTGPYAIGNVSIISHLENSIQALNRRKGIPTNNKPWNKGQKGGKCSEIAIKAWQTKRINGTDTPWNKDTTGIVKAWNKGLKLKKDQQK